VKLNPGCNDKNNTPKEEFLHKQIGLKHKEETDKMLH
jgi:hypothetical protein